MRTIVFHRRAASYLSRMPRDRAAQVRDALVEVAGLDNIASHPGIKQMSGGMAGWSRLRIGSTGKTALPLENRVGDVPTGFFEYIKPNTVGAYRIFARWVSLSQVPALAPANAAEKWAQASL